MEETTNNKPIEESNIQEFEINQLVVNAHNKIAKWHNDEPTNQALKFLSLELVEEIAGAAFKHLGLEYTQGIKMDEETKVAYNKAKNLDSKTGFTKPAELSDAELLRELAKRNLKL